MVTAIPATQERLDKGMSGSFTLEILLKPELKKIVFGEDACVLWERAAPSPQEDNAAATQGNKHESFGVPARLRHNVQNALN